MPFHSLSDASRMEQYLTSVITHEVLLIAAGSDHEQMIMLGSFRAVLRTHHVTAMPTSRVLRPPPQVKDAKAKGMGEYAAGVAMVVAMW